MVLEPSQINVRRPRLAEALIRTKVEDYLKDPVNTRNKQLWQPFSQLDPIIQQQFLQVLLTIRPINLSLLNTYDLSKLSPRQYHSQRLRLLGR